MSEALFRQIGPYEIRRQIGRGGMARVFLAEDTRASGRTVALKVLETGPDQEQRDIADAERRGVELQQRFLATSGFVPELYEVGEVDGYLYIAMEYLDGEDLSALIRRGPVDPTRAAGIAIQLCRFLEEIDHLAVSEASALTLLHNDLKPTNIRVTAGDRVKVLDFGAAKALSMSRRVTRNDFYSTPYLSPECLDSGERDRQTDAWALGVILYEIVAGFAPFREHDTRRLEDRIRSRRPPSPISHCPPGLEAVIFKLLAAEPADRYTDATDLRTDLEKFVAGTPTEALSLGWPARAGDEPPTRRTPREPRNPNEPATRPNGSGLESVAAAGHLGEDEPATRKLPRAETPAAPVPASGLNPAGAENKPQAKPASKPLRYIRIAAVLAVLVLLGNEACVFSEAREVAAAAPTQELAGLGTAWDQYDRLSRSSYLGVTRGLGLALKRQTVILADRVAANYRTPAPNVREAQWAAAAGALERALAFAPGDDEIRGTLLYAQGRLKRINGEADKYRKETTSAQRNFSEAVTAFREAASLRKNWPDPFIGLARTFIYGLEDVDRGADAMTQAQKLGHAPSPRETAQLADGYAARSESLNRASSEVRGMPQEREFLTRAREACQKALEQYATIPDFPEVPAHIRVTQRRLEVVERKLAEIEGRSWLPDLEGLGRMLVPQPFPKGST